MFLTLRTFVGLALPKMQPCTSHLVRALGFCDPRTFLQSLLQFFVDNNAKMPKRKREDGDAPDAESRNGVKQRRTEHKLKLGAIKLGHAFKVAKGFERQKLGRRRKNAVSQNNPNDVKRIDAEIEALKVRLTSDSTESQLGLTKPRRRSIHPHMLNSICTRLYRR